MEVKDFIFTVPKTGIYRIESNQYLEKGEIIRSVWTEEKPLIREVKMNKKRCNECGQVINKKVYYIGDCISEGLGAILLDKKESPDRVGEIVLAIVPESRIFYVWYLNEKNFLEDGNYFLNIKQAIENYEVRE